MDISHLQGSIDELESLAKELINVRNPLLESALEPLNFLFNKDKEDKYVFEYMEKKDIKLILDELQKDIIPLMEESEFEKGIEKVKKWEEFLVNHLRE
jgi:hypothetical protein